MGAAACEYGRKGGPQEAVVEMGPYKTGTVQWQRTLKSQMQAWRDDPHWHDETPTLVRHSLTVSSPFSPARAQVSAPKGAFCQIDSEVTMALPPDAVYNILCDPCNRRVFKNIRAVTYRRVLEDDGDRQLVEVEQSAVGKFLIFSGSCDVRIFVRQDRLKHTMSFAIARPGFMRRFEGSWQVDQLPVPCSRHVQAMAAREREAARGKGKDTKGDGRFGWIGGEMDREGDVFFDASDVLPEEADSEECCADCQMRMASRVRLQQVILLAMPPPPPFDMLARNKTAHEARDMLTSFMAEARRLREAPFPIADGHTAFPDPAPVPDMAAPAEKLQTEESFPPPPPLVRLDSHEEGESSGEDEEVEETVRVGEQEKQQEVVERAVEVGGGRGVEPHELHLKRDNGFRAIRSAAFLHKEVLKSPLPRKECNWVPVRRGIKSTPAEPSNILAEPSETPAADGGEGTDAVAGDGDVEEKFEDATSEEPAALVMDEESLARQREWEQAHHAAEAQRQAEAQQKEEEAVVQMDGYREGRILWRAELERQMRAWRDDPEWRDEAAQLTVSTPKGTFCQLDCQVTLALPPDAVYNTLCDPYNRRVFKNIKAVKHRKVLEDDGDRQLVEVEQSAAWRFLVFSGSFDTRLLVTQDRAERTVRCMREETWAGDGESRWKAERNSIVFHVARGSHASAAVSRALPPLFSLLRLPPFAFPPSPAQMSFKIAQPGFMRRFEGFWRVEPLPVPGSADMRTVGEAEGKGGTETAEKGKSAAEGTGKAGAAEGEAGGGAEGGEFEDAREAFDSRPAGEAGASEGSAGGEGTNGEGASERKPGHGARMASRVHLQQVVQLALSPPPPLDYYVRGITAQVVRDMLGDFQAETKRVRYGGADDDGEGDGKATQEGVGGRIARMSAAFLHREALGGKSGKGKGMGWGKKNGTR
ncbi:unnamed protein product [Closterium sp. NIES-65]|nr:unnamed protein product [Closterium sp. NIES-65]